MNKIKLLKTVNFLLVTSFVLQAISVIAMVMEIAPGWLYRIHGINGIAFILLAIIHILLNWSWIKANFLKRNENISK